MKNAEGQKLMYSELSLRNLADNDTTRYDGRKAVRFQTQNQSHRTTQLLNKKMQFMKYVTLEPDDLK